MGITRIGSNLNTFGNYGQFETDPSTWFFGTDSLRAISRQGLLSSKGSYCCQCVLKSTISSFGSALIQARTFTMTAGKKYIISAKVSSSASSPIGNDADDLYISSAINTSNYTVIESITKTVAEAAVDGFEFLEISLSIEVTTSSDFAFRIFLSDEGINGGVLFADEFEIYEYEDDTPPLPCDIAIDIANTVVNAQTGPTAGDGTILVAHTGTARTDLEYSKNGGSTYIRSPYFAGLDAGTYNIIIRETGDLSCASSHSFIVSTGTAQFSITPFITHESVIGANDGSIVISTSGDGFPFTYSINGGTSYQSSNIFTGLDDGDYSLSVKDVNGTTVTEDVTINVGESSFDFTTTVTHETNIGDEDGEIEVTTSGTGSPFTYSKNGGSSYQSSNIFAGLAPGNYSIVARADDNNTVTKTVTINVGTVAFDFTTSVTDESVKGNQDGEIEVTVSGTGSPFTYSKNGGSSYQSSNIFSNLSAGRYTIGVRNNAGYARYRFATVNEGQIIFSRVVFSENLIPYSLAQTGNSSEDNYRIYNEVRTKPVTSGTFVKRISNAKEPDINGEVVFNLRPAFRDLLPAAAPSINSTTIDQLLDRTLYFKNFYGDIYDALTVPASFGESTQDLVILGGIDKRRYPDVDYFEEYLPTNKKFMTWSPRVKDIDKYQEDYLQYFVFDSTVTKLNKVIKAYFDDDTTQTKTIQSTAVSTLYGDLYRIPAGPDHGGALGVNSTKNLIKYEIWLTDISNIVISEVMVYNITKYTQPNTRYILFLNSLGAHEVLRITGKSSTEATINKETVEKHLDFDYSALDGQYQSSAATRQEVIKYSTGFYSGQYGEYYTEYLQELVMSKQVYDITTGERVPINILPGTFKMKTDDDHMYYLRFTAIAAYQDEVFTPKSLPTLGS